MTSFKKTSFMFVIALGLLGAACGEDDSGTDTDMDPIDGDTGQCVGSYQGFTAQQITDNITNPMAACANPADIEGVCELDPATKAAEVGRACFIAYVGDDSLSDEEKAKKTGDCALNGVRTQPGLKDMLKTMSEDCLNCYIGTVVCAAQKCISTCVAGGEPCDQCRQEEGCTPTFFACSGLPTGAELGAGQ